MKHTDGNGIEWTVIGAYQVAVIDGNIVVDVAPGVALETDDAVNAAKLAFRRDLDALINAGYIAPAPKDEQ